MAPDKVDRLNILTTEQRKELTKLGDGIARARAGLAMLQELGLGVSDLSSKLEWADKRRKTLLEKG